MACSALKSLASNSEGMSKYISPRFFFQHRVQACIKCTRRRPRCVTRWACVGRLLVGKGAVELVVAAMQTHLDASRVQEQGSAVLSGPTLRDVVLAFSSIPDFFFVALREFLCRRSVNTHPISCFHHTGLARCYTRARGLIVAHHFSFCVCVCVSQRLDAPSSRLSSFASGIISLLRPHP